MASRAAHKRLTKEYKALQAEWPPFIYAKPEEGNILVWHYVFLGPPDSPYKDGEYHGTLTFPETYPFAPPAIRMMTPSGRFEPNARICTSMSDFHPGLFNPAWGISTILVGLLSFMLSEESTAGSKKMLPEERQALAKSSRAWNRNPAHSRKFLDVFKEELSSGSMDAILQATTRKAQQTTENQSLQSPPVITPNTDVKPFDEQIQETEKGMSSRFARWRWGGES